MRSSVLLLLLAAACTPRPATTPATPAPALHAETFGSTRPADVRTLVIVLHGDAGADPYPAARALAAAIPQSAAVALLRPGYADPAGRSSPGTRGVGNGDNYTADRVAAVADSVAALRRRYPRARSVIVGQDGGAAIAASVAGTRSGLADALLLAGCPCMLDEWRAGMAKRSPGTGYDRPVDSLDPLQTSGGVPSTLRAAVLVGADDADTPPALSRGYAEALALRGVAVDFRILPGRGHDILADPETAAAAVRLAAALPRLP